MDKKEVLIEVKDLKKYFQVGRNQTLKAVDGVNFKIYKGETLGIVGESGCGKTTCGKTVMGLYKATGGEVLFDGVDINKLNKNEKKEFTKRAQIIFQDPDVYKRQVYNFFRGSEKEDTEATLMEEQ